MKIQIAIFIIASYMISLLGCSKSSLIDRDSEMQNSNIKSGDPEWIYYRDGVIESNLDSLVDFKIAFVDAQTYEAFFFYER